MKKLMSFLAIAIVGIAFMPNVYAESITNYGNVKDITQEGEHFDDSSYSSTTSGSNQDFVLTIDAGKLKVIDKDKDGVSGRNVDDATWIGVSIDTPTTGTFNDACYIRHGETKCNKPFNKDYDSNQKYSLWIPFTASELEEALKNQGADAVVSKTYTIRWNGENDTTNVQTITVKVKANAVTLETDKDSGAVEATATLTAEKKAAAIATYEASKAKNELDDVPNTGSTLPIALMGLLTLVTGTGIYTLKTAYSRK